MASFQYTSERNPMAYIITSHYVDTLQVAALQVDLQRSNLQRV